MNDDKKTEKEQENKYRRSLMPVFVSIGLWIFFPLLFLYILPIIPTYPDLIDKWLHSNNVQFMALIATLLGFTVVINYLISLIYKIKEVGRDQEEMNSRLKDVESKLELAKKLGLIKYMD